MTLILLLLIDIILDGFLNHRIFLNLTCFFYIFNLETFIKTEKKLWCALSTSIPVADLEWEQQAHPLKFDRLCFVLY